MCVCVCVYVQGVGHDHVCAIFADSAPSNVCEFPIIYRRSWNFGGYLLGSLLVYRS